MTSQSNDRPGYGYGTLRDLVEDVCRTPIDVLRTIEAERSPLVGDVARDHGLFGLDSLDAYVAETYRSLAEAPRCFSEARSILKTPQHAGSVVWCRDDVPHPFVFQGETGKTSVVEMLGVSDQMLDLPLPMALLPDRCLIMPEGFSWVSVRTESSRDFVLRDPDGFLMAMMGEDYRSSGAQIAVDLAGERLWVSRVSLQHLANLGEALTFVECETCDERRLAPHDRRGGDEAMDLLFRHCCSKASRSIRDGSIGHEPRPADPAGVPLEQALAAQYAASYAESDGVRDALCSEYLDSGRAVRLSQLVDECASGHAAADLELIQESFEERGVTQARITARAHECWSGNASLRESARRPSPKAPPQAGLRQVEPGR